MGSILGGITKNLYIFQSSVFVLSVVPGCRAVSTALYILHFDEERTLLSKLLLLFAAGYPKVKVFHTARTLDEVILLAPLLDHPCVFDISLHYTGKTPLTTCTLIMPSPVPLDSENPCGHFACDTETLLHLQDAPNLKVYNGDASASIANSKALSKAFSERLNIHSVAHDSKNSKNSGRKSISMMSKKINNKFAGKEVGGFKKVTPTFAPDPDPRLVSLRGKWESLVVWVGAWLVAFASLVCFLFLRSVAWCRMPVLLFLKNCCFWRSFVHLHTSAMWSVQVCLSSCAAMPYISFSLKICWSGSI